MSRSIDLPSYCTFEEEWFNVASCRIFSKIQNTFEQQAVTVGLLSEKIQIFVSASLALKLRIYTQNTPIRRNPSSEFRKKIFLTVIF